MATIRIHEDQNRENQGPDPRNKMHAGNGGNQKRVALGELRGKRHENNVQAFKDQQGLGHTKLDSIANYPDKENWGNNQKENKRKNIVNPIIPVAQFEAFKVYEDAGYEEKYAKINEKLRSKSTSLVYKGTIEDRFVTKKEVAELERKGIIPKPEPKDELPSPIPAPMSVEKDCETEVVQVVTRKDIKILDDFFTMDEYRTDIYKYLREHELRSRAKSGYMKKQPDVSASMRSILVDWLVEVAEEYRLQTETLYLAVNYIDRFLSYMSVVRGKLQLVGTAAMFLASKYEEIYPPDIGEFVYITDDTYTRRQVVRMEQLIVKVLGFDLSVPTPLAFITVICSMISAEEKIKFLAMYVCELTMLDGEAYLEYLPSQLAASAIVIAHFTLDIPIRTDDFVKNTCYNFHSLQPCIDFLFRTHLQAATNPQHAIQDKYKSQKYLHVSQISPKYDSVPLAKNIRSE